MYRKDFVSQRQIDLPNYIVYLCVPCKLSFFYNKNNNNYIFWAANQLVPFLIIGCNFCRYVKEKTKRYRYRKIHLRQEKFHFISHLLLCMIFPWQLLNKAFFFKVNYYNNRQKHDQIQMYKQLKIFFDFSKKQK